MLVGYNTNISYKDKVYHIQTEDSGQGNPVIVTLLYSKGAILASKKTSYEQIVTAPDFQEKVRKIMKAQHKFMIRELLSGKYTTASVEEGEQIIESGEAEKAGGGEETAARGEVGPVETQEKPLQTADSQGGGNGNQESNDKEPR